MSGKQGRVPGLYGGGAVAADFDGKGEKSRLEEKRMVETVVKKMNAKTIFIGVYRRITKENYEL